MRRLREGWTYLCVDWKGEFKFVSVLPMSNPWRYEVHGEKYGHNIQHACILDFEDKSLEVLQVWAKELW